MGLTKQYLRYTPAGNANIIASPRCNVIFVTLEAQEGRYIAAAACEHVYIWDLRRGEKVFKRKRNKLSLKCNDLYSIKLMYNNFFYRHKCFLVKKHV